MTKAKLLFGLLAACLLMMANRAAATTVTVQYPSPSSTVVDSGLNHGARGDYCCFWSAARGDSITQTYITGQPSVNSLDLSFGVPFDNLVLGQSVDWNVLLNGALVGSWSWSASEGTGTENFASTFAPIVGAGTYTIMMAVTNEVPAGSGSIGINYGTATLGSSFVPEPGTLSLLLSTGLVGVLRAVRRKWLQ